MDVNLLIVQFVLTHDHIELWVKGFISRKYINYDMPAPSGSSKLLPGKLYKKHHASILMVNLAIVKKHGKPIMPPGLEAPAARLPGVLIGKGGDTINTLRRDSGASINVSRDEAQGNDARQ